MRICRRSHPDLPKITDFYQGKGAFDDAKQQKALLALLTSPTRERAAVTAGITSKTLRGYLEIPEFREAYKKAFAGLVEDTTRQAQQALAPALSTPKEIVEDGEGGRPGPSECGPLDPGVQFEAD